MTLIPLNILSGVFAGGLSLLTVLNGLWTPPEPPEPPEEVSNTLQEIRGAGCTSATDPNANAFAETAFGRGEWNKAGIAEDAQTAMAGILAAESDGLRQQLAEPFLNGADANAEAAIRVALAYAALRHRANKASVNSKVRRLLSGPEKIETISDTHYLRAALALERRAYGAAKQHARRALEIAPEFYNAQVVHGLALLSEVPEAVRKGACGQALGTVTAAIKPLFSTGACKLHVGHFELAAQRYLPQPRDAAGHEAQHMQSAILAFIVGKDDALASMEGAQGSLVCGSALSLATKR